MVRPPKRVRASDFWENRAYDRSEDSGIDNVDDSDSDTDPTDQVVVHDSDYEGNETETEENSSQICITPFIACLARHYYRRLYVGGSSIQTIDLVSKKILINKDAYKSYMRTLVEVVRRPLVLEDEPTFERDDELQRTTTGRHSRMTLFKQMNYRDIPYKLWDFVILRADKEQDNPNDLLESGRPTFFPDLFEIGRILIVKKEPQTVHIQWLEHASGTLLSDLAHPQELFLTNQCQDVPIRALLGRVKVHEKAAGDRMFDMGADEFFYSTTTYVPSQGVFRDSTKVELNPLHATSPGSCLLCQLRMDREERTEEDSSIIGLDDGSFGFEKHGESYHCCDVVLYRIEGVPGPCSIGHISKITDMETNFELELKVLKLVGDLRKSRRKERPETAPVAESFEDRELVWTEKVVTVSSSQVIGRVFVLHRELALRFGFRDWLTTSPKHFILSESIANKRLQHKDVSEFLMCQICMQKETEEASKTRSWRSERQNSPLRLFDPFAGCGAFSIGMGMGAMGTLKLTHAIEIDASAAETIKKNTQGLATNIYRQCANRALKYALEDKWEIDVDDRTAVLDDTLEDLPQKGDIECLITGFPCQPHSSMNRFKNPDKSSNDMYLNVVAWADHLRPKYCLFENVEHFVHHEIAHKTVYKNGRAEIRDGKIVREGIKQGGLLFVVRALTSLGYQVRFGLLQAAHFGTPQTRLRFFLWAARSGLPLPEFPEPTHDFKSQTNQVQVTSIKMKNGDIVRTINPKPGNAPLAQVTVQEAISDLKRWDWANPHIFYSETDEERQAIHERGDIPQVKTYYKRKQSTVHPPGHPASQYRHGPMSAFQAKCRLKHPVDAQHFTRCLKDEIVERVCNISMRPGGNANDLQRVADLFDYQMIDPRSASGKQGYRNPMYKRLDPNGHFQTIVTHVLPTAKQNHVLNPWCNRMLSVRELARAQGFPDDFKFEYLDGKVTTLHRMIGNAVPWPLSEALGLELEKAWRKETYLVDE